MCTKRIQKVSSFATCTDFRAYSSPQLPVYTPSVFKFKIRHLFYYLCLSGPAVGTVGRYGGAAVAGGGSGGGSVASGPGKRSSLGRSLTPSSLAPFAG